MKTQVLHFFYLKEILVQVNKISLSLILIGKSSFALEIVNRRKNESSSYISIYFALKIKNRKSFSYFFSNSCTNNILKKFFLNLKNQNKAKNILIIIDDIQLSFPVTSNLYGDMKELADRAGVNFMFLSSQNSVYNQMK